MNLRHPKYKNQLHSEVSDLTLYIEKNYKKCLVTSYNIMY